MYRQGDVLIIPTKKLPAKLTETPREDGAVVLAYGEVTGHRHRIHDPGVCLLSKEGLSDRFLTIAGEDLVHLVHEEHATIDLAPGNYIVRIQREYDWASEASRNVED